MNNNCKKIKELLNTEQTGPIFFITPNPIYAIGLEKIIKNYFVICSQRSDIVRYFRKEKISVLCINDDKIKNAGKILINKKAIEYIKKKSKKMRANIITFKPSPTIQKICKDNDFKYLGNDWRLNRNLEDKIEFTEVTKKLKIPNADSKIIKLDKDKRSLNFSKNNKFVIQFPRGFSGNSTFLIKDENDLDKIFKKYGNRKVKLAEYFEGETYTINACVVGNKILISSLIFQITGLSLYNKNSLGTCGNDYAYSKKLKKEQREKIFNYTKKVGNYIKKLGYKGIFGLDFVVSNNEINLIEINPRIIGSMSLFTKLQIQNKEMPFLLSHILGFVGNDQILLEGDIGQCRFQTKSEPKFFNASQLILRNTENKPIKIIKSLKSGIYEIKKNKLVFKKGVSSAEKKLKKNELLVQSSVKGQTVSPDIEYANVQVGYGIMKNEKEFKTSFDKIINLVLKSIKIEIIK